jgi:hypothetical protein
MQYPCNVYPLQAAIRHTRQALVAISPLSVRVLPTKQLLALSSLRAVQAGLLSFLDRIALPTKLLRFYPPFALLIAPTLGLIDETVRHSGMEKRPIPAETHH